MSGLQHSRGNKKMLQAILNKLNKINLESEGEPINDIKNSLPFEIIDRYGAIQPKPTITWSYSTYDFDSVYKSTVEYGIHHDKLLAQILYESAKDGPGRGYIVELGTQYGSGTCLLASGSKARQREKVITIDNDRGEIGSLYSSEFWDRHPVEAMRFEMNCIMMGIHDWVITIGGSSKWAAQSLNLPVRVLYIDANHEYNGCASDILMWKDKIITGGLVILHDYSDHAVKQAIADYIVNSDDFTDIIEISEMAVLTQKK